MTRKYNRRTFLKKSLAVSAGLSLTASGNIFTGNEVQSANPSPNRIPKRHLGKTGQEVSIYGLGGEFTPAMIDRHDEAVEIINHALDLGINYIDTSAWYGTGTSELNIGTVMKKRRSEVFLASKSHDYTYDGTMALVEQSLRRLQTDHIDLYQHHFLGGSGKLEQLQQKNSARQAFEKLRDDGVIKYIGVTGHSSKVLAEAISDYPYDSALITLNAARSVMDDPEYLDQFFRLAKEKDVGVIAMKVVGHGELVKRGLGAEKLLSYALSFPISTAIVGISEIQHLKENVRIVKAFKPFSKDEMTEFETTARNMISGRNYVLQRGGYWKNVR